MRDWCCESCGLAGAVRLGAGLPYCAACRGFLTGKVPFDSDVGTATLSGYVPRCVSCGEPTTARRKGGTPCCPGHLETWPEYMDPARACFVEQQSAAYGWTPVWGGSWVDAWRAKQRGEAYEFDRGPFTFTDHRTARMRIDWKSGLERIVPWSLTDDLVGLFTWSLL